MGEGGEGTGSWTSQKSLFRARLYREVGKLSLSFLAGPVTPGESSVQVRGSVTGRRHLGLSLLTTNRAGGGQGVGAALGKMGFSQGRASKGQHASSGASEHESLTVASGRDTGPQVCERSTRLDRDTPGTVHPAWVSHIPGSNPQTSVTTVLSCCCWA